MVVAYPELFPLGLETPANGFLPQLRERFPSSEYIIGNSEQSAQRELAEQITLRDLLNHRSGLGNQTDKDFDEPIKPNPDQRLKEGELLELDRKKGVYGEQEYSNQGYELLGMIMCAIEQSIQKRSISHPVVFSEVIEKYVLAPKNLVGQIFASDQMEVSENRVQVHEHPELTVRSGKYYHGGKGFGTDCGALGSYYPDGKKDLALTAMNTEDLTYPLAVTALLDEETQPEINDHNIYNKAKDLKQEHTEEQLLQMRKESESAMRIESSTSLDVSSNTPDAQSSAEVLNSGVSKSVNVPNIELPDVQKDKGI